MSDITPRLSLPYMSSSQSQKEVTHNEGLNNLDALLQVAIESMALTSPPTGVEGNLYIIATGATGTWVSKDNYLVQYIGSAWAYYTPFEGMRVWDKNTSMAMVYKNSAWEAEITANSKIGFFSTTPVAKTTVTLANADGDIGGLIISEAYSQTEVQALRDKTEILADDVRALKAALASYGLV